MSTIMVIVIVSGPQPTMRPTQMRTGICGDWYDTGFFEQQERICYNGGSVCYQQRACPTCQESACIGGLAKK